MMPRVPLLRGLTLVGAALATGCTKSPEARAREAASALASWEATVRLLEEQRARGALPGQFVRQVRRAAADAREEASAQRRAAGAP
jgi:hypothetical protein